MKGHMETVKTTKASATAALIKAKAEHAASLVKATFMEEKYALEAKQRAIQRKLEALELENKIAQVNAKLAVLNASKKQRVPKSNPGQEEAETSMPQPLVNDSKASQGLKEIDWEGPEIYVPVKNFHEDTWAGDAFNEVDWEGPEIFVPVSVACEDTGAGDTTKTPPSLNLSPGVPHPEVQGSYQDVLISDMDPTMKPLSERGSPVNQLPTNMVATGSPKDDLSNNKGPEEVVIAEEDSDGLVAELPLRELDCSGPSADTLPNDDFCDAVCNLTAAIAMPPQTLGEHTLVYSGPMNSKNFTIVIVICFLFLFDGQAHKLFKLKHYKAFKRKRWIPIY